MDILTMPYVRVKQKYQVTIPVILRDKLHLKEGDTLEAGVKNGSIILTPQDIIKKDTRKQVKDKLASYIGSAKGMFKTPQEANDFIRKERDLWD